MTPLRRDKANREKLRERIERKVEKLNHATAGQPGKYINPAGKIAAGIKKYDAGMKRVRLRRLANAGRVLAHPASIAGLGATAAGGLAYQAARRKYLPKPQEDDAD